MKNIYTNICVTPKTQITGMLTGMCCDSDTSWGSHIVYIYTYILSSGYNNTMYNAKYGMM